MRQWESHATVFRRRFAAGKLPPAAPSAEVAAACVEQNVNAPPSVAATSAAAAASKKATKQQNAAPAGQEIVGKRIRVYWPADKAWYSGSVEAYDGKSKHHGRLRTF